MTNNLNDLLWPKLVRKQYFYSGGSLREFCKTHEDLVEQVEDDCGNVANAQAYLLIIVAFFIFGTSFHVSC